MTSYRRDAQRQRRLDNARKARKLLAQGCTWRQIAHELKIADGLHMSDPLTYSLSYLRRALTELRAVENDPLVKS